MGEGEWAESADTVEGRYSHKRVDKASGNPPKVGVESDEDARIHVRSLELSSDALGLIAKLDLAEFEGRRAVPVDYKRGKRPHVEHGAYQPERVQLCVQALLLEEHGYDVPEGVLYFRGFARTREGGVRRRAAGCRPPGRGRPAAHRRADAAAAGKQPKVPALLAGRHLPA
jgi:CRISPR/Cas system-associated exonuclease Cas4 (RecB family)